MRSCNLLSSRSPGAPGTLGGEKSAAVSSYSNLVAPKGHEGRSLCLVTLLGCVATFTEPLSALRDDPPGPQGLRAPRWLPAPTPTSHQSRPAHLRVQGIPSPRPTRRSFCAHPRTRRALAVVHPETRSLASGTHAVTRPPRRRAQNLSIQPVRPDVTGVKQPI